VAATRRQTRGIYGFLFIIESAKFNPVELQTKIEAFIVGAYDKLKAQPEVINKFHMGLIARKKEGFKDIKEESSYLFG